MSEELKLIGEIKAAIAAINHQGQSERVISEIQNKIGEFEKRNNIIFNPSIIEPEYEERMPF